MSLAEVLGSDIAMRKIIWSKRGDKITRRVIDQKAEFDIQPRTRLDIKTKDKEKDNAKS